MKIFSKKRKKDLPKLSSYDIVMNKKERGENPFYNFSVFHSQKQPEYTNRL